MSHDSQTPISKTRKHSEISPDLEQNTSKKQCQVKGKMDEELKRFLEGIKNDVSMLHDKMDELNRKFDGKIEKLELDIKQVQEDIIDVKAEIIPIEEKIAEMSLIIQRHEAEINSLNQNALKNQLIMINIAPSINEEQFLESMNRWTLDLTKTSFDGIKLLKTQTSQSAILDFTATIHKKKFLEFIKRKQKDQQNKYNPILNEHIFKLPDTDIHRASVIEFRTAMTKINREIFNKAREVKKGNKTIEGVWIANGLVNIRIKNVKKPYRLISLKQLNDLQDSLGRQRP